MVAEAVALAGLVPAALAGAGLFALTAAGLRPRRAAPRAPTHSFAVVVPAHNEECTLPAALEALATLDYPPELVRVCVIADNCTDGTAHVARAFGADVIERTDPRRRGKGFALALAVPKVLEARPDAVLVLDADCTLNADALRALDALFADGADAIQAAVRGANPDAGATGLVAAVGAAFDATTAAGRDRFGFSAPLRGTGMAFRARVLARVPWTTTGLTEDAEYGARLREAGVRVRYCAEAEVTSAAPPSAEALFAQRRRWRAAGPASSKPLALALVALACALGAAGGFVLWAGAVAGLFAALYLRALLAVGVTRGRLKSLFGAPLLVARLALGAAVGPFRRTGPWVRTMRAGEARR
jgi:GT2 family glycosyltransferase